MQTRRELWLNALLANLQAEFPTAMFSVPSYVPEDLPACTLWDDTETGQTDLYGDQTVETTVQIEAFEDLTQAVGTLAEQMSAQNAQGQGLLSRVVKAATGGDRTLGGLCDDIVYSSGAVQYPGDGETQMSAGGTFRVSWRHKLGDPYTAGA